MPRGGGRAGIVALAVAALVAPTPLLRAELDGEPSGLVLRFPSSDLSDLTALQNAIATPTVSAIVVEPGTYQLAGTLFVFGRDDLTICGATGDPRDVVFEFPEPPLVPETPPPLLEIVQARRIALRGLTLRTQVQRGAAVLVNARFTSQIESFADDVVVDHCALEGYVGVQASAHTRNLTLTRSRVTSTPSPVDGLPARQGGVGVLWEDGDGLFVAANRFRTAFNAPTVAAVFVRGAQTAEADGQRARRIFLTRNAVSGNFARGFLCDDIVDGRFRGNRISFPGPLTNEAVPGIPEGAGRCGFIVLRANASAPTEDFELHRNRVRKAYYAAWLVNTGDAAVRENDFRGCGSAVSDSDFIDPTVNGGVDHGGGLRLNLQFGTCGIVIERNDFRGLRSPADEPAIVSFPGGSEGICTSEGNRVGRSRRLYLREDEDAEPGH